MVGTLSRKQKISMLSLKEEFKSMLNKIFCQAVCEQRSGHFFFAVRLSFVQLDSYQCRCEPHNIVELKHMFSLKNSMLTGASSVKPALLLLLSPISRRSISSSMQYIY